MLSTGFPLNLAWIHTFYLCLQCHKWARPCPPYLPHSALLRCSLNSCHTPSRSWVFPCTILSAWNILTLTSHLCHAYEAIRSQLKCHVRGFPWNFKQSLLSCPMPSFSQGTLFYPSQDLAIYNNILCLLNISSLLNPQWSNFKSWLLLPSTGSIKNTAFPPETWLETRKINQTCRSNG